MRRRVDKRSWLRVAGLLTMLATVPQFAPDLFAVACPHHAGHFDSQDASESVEGAGQADAHHGDGSHGATTPGPATDAPPPCTCAGECPVVDAPTVLADGAAPANVEALAVHVARVEAPQVREAPSRRYLQPPAMAPPTS